MAEQQALKEHIIQVRRCACVVKGGRRFSFTALVVVGDGNGTVGFGYGKGNEVPQAVEKAVKSASRRTIKIPVERTTIPHNATGKYCASRVMLMPANPGTGVIAGASIRAIAEAIGVRDLLTKSRGSSNPLNVVQATFKAIASLRSRELLVAKRRVLQDAN